jgi:hypothetical protein
MRRTKRARLKRKKRMMRDYSLVVEATMIKRERDLIAMQTNTRLRKHSQTMKRREATKVELNKLDLLGSVIVRNN